jgi:hypothetical protein
LLLQEQEERERRGRQERQERQERERRGRQERQERQEQQRQERQDLAFARALGEPEEAPPSYDSLQAAGVDVFRGSFEATNFQREYGLMGTTPGQYKFSDQMSAALRGLIDGRQRRNRAPVTEEQAQDYFNRLQADVMQRVTADAQLEVLHDVHATTQRMWTSVQKLPPVPHGIEFCGILNEAIREDYADTARDAAVLCRSLNQLLVTRRDQPNQQQLAANAPWACPACTFENRPGQPACHMCGAPAAPQPRQPAARFPPNATCWRGGGLLDEHRAWYDAHVGRKYRVPMLLATSFSEGKADEFLGFAHDRGEPAVKWEVRVDRRGETTFQYRCKQVAFLTRTDLPDELEYLFAAYSVFTVLEVHWSDAPGRATPHRIVLRAAIDNSLEPEGLPLAPYS